MNPLFALLLPAGLLAVQAATDWSQILVLDAGPKEKPRTTEEARAVGMKHLDRTERALRTFLAENPGSPHLFEARMRLASIDAARGKISNRQSLVDQSMRTLAELEKDPQATPTQRADAGFRRISLLMQSLQGMEWERRSDLVDAARRFKNAHPADQRVPRVMVEVATVCDTSVRRALLEEALPMAKEKALRERISDDLRRVDLIGKPLEFPISTIDGKSIPPADPAGRPTIVIFWASDSMPCLVWMRSFRQARLPLSGVRIVTASLDASPDMAKRALADAGLGDWPILCDGKGWHGPWVRSIGINALPSVWILDRHGIVRTTDARTNFEPWIRKLISAQ